MKQTLEELKLWFEDTAISGRNVSLSYCPFSLTASSVFFQSHATFFIATTQEFATSCAELNQ